MDTDKKVRQLERSGTTRAQAIAFVQAQQDALAQILASLATKADIARLEARLKKRLDTLTWQLTVLWGALRVVAVPIALALLKLP